MLQKCHDFVTCSRTGTAPELAPHRSASGPRPRHAPGTHLRRRGSAVRSAGRTAAPHGCRGAAAAGTRGCPRNRAGPRVLERLEGANGPAALVYGVPPQRTRPPQGSTLLKGPRHRGCGFLQARSHVWDETRERGRAGPKPRVFSACGCAATVSPDKTDKTRQSCRVTSASRLKGSLLAGHRGLRVLASPKDGVRGGERCVRRADRRHRGRARAGN